MPNGETPNKDGAPVADAAQASPEQSVLASAVDAKPDPAKTPAPTETKPGDATAKPDEKKEGDPAKVEPFDIKLPDGFNADPAFLDEFKKLAQESGLKSDVAQKLVEFQAKINAAAQAKQKADAEEFTAKEAAWRTEAMKIPPAELSLAKRAMLTFTKDLPAGLRDETRQVLQDTWMGNHPGVLRVLAQAGKFIAEDTLAEEGTGGRAPTGPATAAEMFTSMKKTA